MRFERITIACVVVGVGVGVGVGVYTSMRDGVSAVGNVYPYVYLDPNLWSAQRPCCGYGPPAFICVYIKDLVKRQIQECALVMNGAAVPSESTVVFGGVAEENLNTPSLKICENVAWNCSFAKWNRFNFLSGGGNDGGGDLGLGCGCFAQGS